MEIFADVPHTAINTLMGVLITTAIAGLAAYAKKRMTTKSDRQKLKEELSLVKELPEDSSARNHLMASIEERVIRLSYEKIFNGAIGSIKIFLITIMLLGSLFTTAFAFASSPEYRGATIATSIMIWAVTFLGLEVIVALGAYIDMKLMNKQRKEYFETGQYPNPFKIGKPRLPSRSSLAALIAKVKGPIRRLRTDRGTRENLSGESGAGAAS